MRFAAPFLFALMLPVAAGAITVPTKPVKLPPLEQLFLDLKKAASPEEAKPIEEKLGGLFLVSNSPTADLLMARGQAAQTAGDKPTAKKLFEALTDLAPGYAEGWHARASLQREMNDDSGAMVSLGRVILLNPRQFAALYELGSMLEDYGNKAGALKLYRRALDINPQLEGARRHIEALTRDVQGQDI